MMNVVMACTSSALVSGFTSYKRSNTNNFDVQSGLNGFIVGYVSITASSYAIECWEALLISFVARGATLAWRYPALERSIAVPGQAKNVGVT